MPTYNNRRGRSQSRARNYRGKSRSRFQPKKQGGSKFSSTKKHMFATVGESQGYHTYDATFKHLVSTVQKEAKLQTVGDALKNGVHWEYEQDAPVRELSKIQIYKTVPASPAGTRSGGDPKAPSPVTAPPTQYLDKIKQEEKAQEQATFDIIYKSDLSDHKSAVKDYKTGLLTVYNIIRQDYCTPALVKKLELETDFNTKIDGDPIATIQAINRIVHDGSQDGTHICATIYRHLKSLTSLSMTEDESPRDWVDRVKAQFDSNEQMMGNTWLQGWLAEDPDYEAADEAKRRAMSVALRERLISFIGIHKANPKKYGLLQNSLKQSSTLQDDKYPTDLEGVQAVLAQHPWDPAFAEHKRRRNERERPRSEPESQVQNAQRTSKPPSHYKCHCCGSNQHFLESCKYKDDIARNQWFKQTGKVYHQQHAQSIESSEQTATARRSDDSTIGTTHTGTTITVDNNRRSSNATNAYQNFIIAESMSGSTVQDEVSMTQRGRHGPSSDLKKKLTLDSATSCNTICNPDFVDQYRTAKVPTLLHTNTGSKLLTKEAHTPGVGWAPFHKEAMTNIVGIGPIVKANSHRVQLDTDTKPVFILTDRKTGKVTEFAMQEDGLFTYEPSENFVKNVARDRAAKHCQHVQAIAGVTKPKQNVSWSQVLAVSTNFNPDELPSKLETKHADLEQMQACIQRAKTVDCCQLAQTEEKLEELCHDVATVKDNMKFRSHRQIMNAKRARQLQVALGCTTRILKWIIRTNFLKNNPVTHEHVNLAEEIFGPDVAALKGKSTRKQPGAVIDDTVEVPEELYFRNPVVKLEVDLMFIMGWPVLTGIDTTVRYRSYEPIGGQTMQDLMAAFDEIFRFYNNAGFEVNPVHADGQFKPLLAPLMDSDDITVHIAEPGDHVPHAERNNRTLEERTRTTFQGMPLNFFPKLVALKTGQRSRDQLTALPAKGGISSDFSPHTIMTGRTLAYDDIKIPTGSYVQAYYHTEPHNDEAARTRDCIYLRPCVERSGHELMHVPTGELIHHNGQITVCEMTESIVKAVEALAKKQHNRKSFKIETRLDHPLVAAHWIAGVTGEAPEDILAQSIINYDSDDESDSDNDVPPLMNSHDDSDDESDSDDDGPPLTNNYSDHNDSDSDSDDDYDSDDDMPELVHRKPGYESSSSEEEDDEFAPPPIARRKSARRSSSPNRSNPVVRQSTTKKPIASQKSKKLTPKQRPSRKEDRWNLKPRRSTRLATSNSQLQERISIRNKSWTDFAVKQLLCVTTNHELCNAQMDRPDSKDETYDPEMAPVIGMIMNDINNRAAADGVQFAQQHMLPKGLKVFGERGEAATMKEVDQLHRRECFTPIDVSKLTAKEKEKAVQALMFLTEKRDGTVKGRLVYDGSKTRSWHSKEDAASPTATSEGIMLTAVIDSHENRDVLIADVPNAFIQTELPATGERVIMKITGVLVDILVKMSPEVYGPYVTIDDRGRRVLYVEVLRALYGMLIAALLWFKQFKKDLESIGFVFNPYDPCVANKIVNGKQHTVKFHVDDLWSSHIDTKVNDEFLVWLNEKYGAHGEVKATRSKKFDYLGVCYDLTVPGKLTVSMVDYVKGMLRDFPEDLGDKTETHASPANLFEAGTGKLIDPEKAKVFHTFVAKGLFACKRARPDIHTIISVLSSRVAKPTTSDWTKLLHLMRFLNGTAEDVLTLTAESLHILKWFVDVSFAVHPDFKSHTGGGLTLGTGFLVNASQKQKLNTRSSTESELVGADDLSQIILWTRLFMEAQGYEIEKNILHQDNQSTILLLKNGKRSSSKRTRAINIRYFFLTDQIEKGNLQVDYCPTKQMWADFHTKPLQGQLEIDMRDHIMGRK